MIDYGNFKKALKHLELQFQNYQNPDNMSLPVITQEAVKESVIQRFETCCDCMWKVLKRYLKEDLGIPDVPESPKPVFRLAFVNNLLSSDMDFWLQYIDVRNGTAHDYSGEKAETALSLMSNFISDARRLYETMSGDKLDA
ncbi:MAG: nucleotidyltransferase substrate binding protein [Heliobacteriaceae bacterium]|jgi:nucleotidyltransferase substrate binding protein (TIGR01987 family)|nr:nucleotidyltransferase substrate binding protein [Heliobacteriaceae bacterium]